jgi:hypothetical protein
VNSHLACIGFLDILWHEWLIASDGFDYNGKSWLPPGPIPPDPTVPATVAASILRFFFAGLVNAAAVIFRDAAALPPLSSLKSDLLFVVMV